MLSLSCALSHSPVPSLLSCALSALLCPLSLSCSLSAFLHLFLVVSCVPVPLRLPTLPPLPDMMIAAISVMYGSPLCLPSLTAVIAGGLYLLPDTMIVTSWGTAPCTANTVNQCRPLYQQMGAVFTSGDKQTVRPLWGHDNFWRLIWNASKLPYFIS